MGRRTKIPITILLGILFFFVAITLYKGCVVVEAHDPINDTGSTPEKEQAAAAEQVTKIEEKAARKPVYWYDSSAKNVLVWGNLIPLRQEQSQHAAKKGQGQTWLNQAPGHDSAGRYWSNKGNHFWYPSRRRKMNYHYRSRNWKNSSGSQYVTQGEQGLEKTAEKQADVYGALDNVYKKDQERAKQAHEKYKAQQLADATAAALAISTQGASASAAALSAAEGDLKAFPEQASKGNCPGC